MIFGKSRKKLKVWKSVKINYKNCEHLSFSVSFLVNFVFTTLVSQGSENEMLLRKYFYWNTSFCDPQIEGIPKRTIFFEFPLSCHSLFSKNTKLNSLISVSIRIVLLVEEGFFEKIGGFVSCVTIPLVRKFLKAPSSLIYLVIQTDFSQQLHV